MSDSFQLVAEMSELREGQPHAVETDGGEEVLLVRVGDDVYAIQPTCTHQKTWLDLGTVLPRSLEIQCPLHEGRFDLRTGNPTHPPVTEPIKTYAVRLDRGAIYISRKSAG